MSDIKFSKEEQEAVVKKVKMYFQEELNQDIGGFDAEFLINFFATEIGAYFYNQGLYDAQALFTQKVDELGDSIFELEKPTEFSR